MPYNKINVLHEYGGQTLAIHAVFMFVFQEIIMINVDIVVIKIGKTFDKCCSLKEREWYCSITRCFMDSRSLVFSFFKVSTSWAALEDLTPPTSSKAKWASFSLKAAVRAWCLVGKAT